jgi:hypothetical protein
LGATAVHDRDVGAGSAKLGNIQGQFYETG